MNIGFDLDKVFINYPPFISPRLIDRFYKNESAEKLTYRIPNQPEQIFRNLSHLPILRRPIKNNIAFLEKLVSNKNNKYYLISSRYSFLRKRTENVVKKYKLDAIFDGLYFNYNNLQAHEFKDDKIKTLKINIYIDDDLALLKYLATNNKSVKFYWLNPQVQKKLSTNLFAITSLQGVFQN